MTFQELVRAVKGWRAEASLRDKLLTTIGTLAIFWYFASILLVGMSDLPGKDGADKDFLTPAARQFMTVSITTISGTLATYLGLVLGFAQVREQQREGAPPPPPGPALANVAPEITRLQAVAAWAYVLSLVVALLLWLCRQEDRVDPVIINQGRSILGLFGGVLAVILNVEKK